MRKRERERLGREKEREILGGGARSPAPKIGFVGEIRQIHARCTYRRTGTL